MDQVKIGNFITKLRLKCNMTQEDVAKKIGVKRQSVSYWENGKTLPDNTQIEKLAKLYKVSVDEIMNGEYSNYKFLKINKFVIFVIVLLLLLLIFTITVIVILLNKKDNLLYSFNGSSNNFKVDNVVLIKEDNIIRFSLGVVDNINNTDISSIQYFYKLEGVEYNIITCDGICNINTIIDDEKNLQKYFDFNRIDEIINNLYINIYYEDGNDLLKLNIDNSDDLEENTTMVASNINEYLISIVPFIESNFNKTDNGYFIELNYENINYNISYLDYNLIIDGGDCLYTYDIGSDYLVFTSSSENIGINLSNINDYNLQNNKEIIEKFIKIVYEIK